MRYRYSPRSARRDLLAALLAASMWVAWAALSTQNLSARACGIPEMHADHDATETGPRCRTAL